MHEDGPFMHLIPEPKIVTCLDTSGPGVRSWGDLDPSECARRLLEDPSCLGAPMTRVSLEDWQKLQGPLPAGFRADQGYALRADSEGVVIAADSQAGHFYAIQTLGQIAAQAEKGRIASLAVIDWPDVSVRGFHACYHLAAEWMPMSAPDFDALIDAVKLSAHYKLNAVLLEFEAMFPFRRHPRLACKQAFTRDQLEAVRHTCAECHVQIVPLIQCLGHAYYVLQYPEYAHLREAPNTIQQYCASNPEVRKLLTELVDEVREVFPDMSHFHLGGDESRRLGVCDKCKDKAHREGVGAVFGEHVGSVAQSVLEMGMTPIVWSDMMERHPTAMDYMPQGTEYMYWNYDLPGWPRELALETFQSKAPTWAASGIRFGRCNHTMYPLGTAARGISLLAAEARRVGCDKIIATDWLKSIPHDLSAIGRTYAAEESWNHSRSWGDFVSAYCLLTHGVADHRLGEAYELLGDPIPYCEDSYVRIYDRLDRYDLTGLSMRERIAANTPLEARDEPVAKMESGLAAAQKSLGIVDEIGSRATRGTRELEVLALSARTNAHKAAMGLAIDQAVPLIKFPAPGDEPRRAALAQRFDALISEHDELRELTGRLLAPTTFHQSLALALDIKFEPAAREWMAHFRQLLIAGEPVRFLLWPDHGPRPDIAGGE